MDTSAADIHTGPVGRGAFVANETVTCDYVARKMTGATPKFECATAEGDRLKVKYGQDNGEVFGEVAATRLFWALGFGADRMYPLRIICRGCPMSLAPQAKVFGGGLVLDFATVERKMPGREYPGPKGWSWSELDQVRPDAGGAPRAHRDALKLLAVIIQHTDSKPEQQRLVCREKKSEHSSHCRDPFMMINDLGNTFGAANRYNRQEMSVNLERWSKTPVWKDPERCIANLAHSVTGTLSNPRISEAGRAFLAGLLVRLSDDQMRALFEVARFPNRLIAPNQPGASVASWVAALKDKIDQVIHRTCPSSDPDQA